MADIQIELVNAEDIGSTRRNFINKERIRQIKITARIDTSFHHLAINENIQSTLQLPRIEKQKFRLNDGTIAEYDMGDMVQLGLKDHHTTCRAIILPGNSEIIVGRIALDSLGLMIDPSTQQLVERPFRFSTGMIRAIYSSSKYSTSLQEDQIIIPGYSRQDHKENQDPIGTGFTKDILKLLRRVLHGTLYSLCIYIKSQTPSCAYSTSHQMKQPLYYLK